MADDNELEVKIVLDDGSIKQGFLRIRKEGKKATYDLSSQFSNVTKTIGKMALGFGAAFAGFQGIKRAVNNLREFETALAEINTITNFTAKQQKQLQSQLIAVSSEFGVSAQEQAKAFYQIISAGVTNTAKANELLIAANKLAIGGLTTTASSIDILTSAVNAFGQENLSADRASDILFATVKLGKTTVEELSSTLGQVLPTSAALGISFEDTNAALAALTTRGISTSEAVTQLNAVFTAVLKKQKTAVTMGKDVAQAFSLQALQAKGLTVFLRDLNRSLGGSEQKLVELTGRAEGARAIMTLAADDFQTLGRNSDDLSNSLGAADAAYKEIDKTLSQKLNISLAKFDGLVLRLSNSIGGPLNTAVSALNSGLSATSDFFDRFAETDIGELARIDVEMDRISEAMRRLNGESTLAEDAFTLLILKTTGINLANQGAGKSSAQLADRFEFLSQKRDKLTTSINAQAMAEAALNSIPPKADVVVPPSLKEQLIEINAEIAKLPETMTGSAEAVSGVFEGMTAVQIGFKQQLLDTVQNSSKSFKEIGKQAFQSMGKGVGGAFAAFGKALANGENALDAFLNSLVSAMGQMAIQLGTQFILQGIAYTWAGMPNGPALIAAGAGLAAFGGILSAVGGGGASESAGATSGGLAGDISLEQPEPVNQGPTNKIDINIAGDILDSDETGLRITQLLQAEIDKSGTSILQVT